MAGGSSTPALAAAVAAAGGFGFVAAGYLSAEQLAQAIATTRQLSGAPFGVNLFVPSAPADPVVVADYAATLQPEADRLGVALGRARWEDDAYDAKLDVVESAGVQLASFTFGCPDPATVDRLHRADVGVAVTVTSVLEARLAVEAGTDLLAVQGTEAGGHQGSFADLAPNRRPLLDLLAEIGEATDVPVIGAGGIMTGPTRPPCWAPEPSPCRSARRCSAPPRRAPPPPTARRSWRGTTRTRWSRAPTAGGSAGGWPTASRWPTTRRPHRPTPRCTT